MRERGQRGRRWLREARGEQAHRRVVCLAFAIRRAAQAGTEARFASEARSLEEAHVLGPRPAGWARRTAVDAGGPHGEDEVPVGARVACEHALPPRIRVEVLSSGRHPRNLSVSVPRCAPVFDSELREEATHGTAGRSATGAA